MSSNFKNNPNHHTKEHQVIKITIRTIILISTTTDTIVRHLITLDATLFTLMAIVGHYCNKYVKLNPALIYGNFRDVLSFKLEHLAKSIMLYSVSGNLNPTESIVHNS